MKKKRLTYCVKLLPGAACLAWWSCGAAGAADRPAEQAFSEQRTPGKGAPQSIGFHSKGCLAGAKALPADGASWQVMRPGRNRNWGHPALITFIKRLSRNAAGKGWPGLLVGDMSQPRGGPILNGHASHQTGLDADIWFTPMPPRPFSLQERKTMPGISMLKDSSLHVDPQKWSVSRTELLKLAATDPQVDRIFVHPGIKQYLCDTVQGDRVWLGRIRPYQGHHWHFHVRLKCQSDSPSCRLQPPVPKGDGCDYSLEWRLSNEPWRPKAGPPARSRVMMVSDLPQACAALVAKGKKNVSSKKAGTQP